MKYILTLSLLISVAYGQNTGGIAHLNKEGRIEIDTSFTQPKIKTLQKRIEELEQKVDSLINALQHYPHIKRTSSGNFNNFLFDEEKKWQQQLYWYYHPAEYILYNTNK